VLESATVHLGVVRHIVLERPGSWTAFTVSLDQPPSCFCTLIIPVEVTQKTYVIAFHRNTGANEQTPRDSFGIELDALQQGHLVLAVGGFLSVADDIALDGGGVEMVLLREI